MQGDYGLGDLGGVLGSTLYDQLFSTQGFSGYNDGFRGDNPWMNLGGFNESGEQSFLTTPTQEAIDSFNNYSFDWAPGGNGAGTLTGYDPKGNLLGSFKQEGEDSFTQLLDRVAPMAATVGFGGALSGMFGGGFLGSAAGQGLASGSMSSMQGGNFGKGFLSGAVSGGMQGLNQTGASPASVVGVSNPTLARIVNRGAGSTLGALASGQSGSDALKSGLTGAGLAGINSLGQSGMNFLNDSLKSWLTPDTNVGEALPDDLMGSGGDMLGQTDVSPNRYEEFTMGSDGLQSYNPDYGFGGDQLPNLFSDRLTPQQSIQSPGAGDFNLPSLFGDVGSSLGNVGMSGLRGLGNYALNNAGDLASMLYGFYNNRRQQKQLGQQLSGLQGMLTQANQQSPAASLLGIDSPYAQNLRNVLNARAAATGRRSNVAGRETQLMGALAEKNAQIQAEYDRNKTSLVSNLAPQMMNLAQAQGKLKNSQMNDILKFGTNSGLFNAAGRGLQSLFSNNTYNNGGYNMTGVQNPYGSDVIFNGWGG